MSEADEVSIDEFARLSRLSPKALRLYDRMGVLEPSRVDPDTGHRRYGLAQLERARLVASLRQVGIPLADIRSAVLGEGMPGAARISEFWAQAEAEHAARRRLVGNLIEWLQGKERPMSIAYHVRVRDLPRRHLLCRTRHVTNEELTTFGREFVEGFHAAGVHASPGTEGAPFAIYYGEVSEDSDGPIEWCWPVPGDEAHALAGRFPRLTLREDPAHVEAYVHYGRATQLHMSRITLAVQSLLSWGADRDKDVTSALRLTYRAGGTGAGTGTGPDLDLSLPVR